MIRITILLIILCISIDAYRFQSKLRLRSPSPSTSSTSLFSSYKDQILRKVDNWACVKNCGACCKLGPLDSRPDLQEYLSIEEFEQYKSMIGDDNWCKNFDKTTRMCTIYETRPEFCKVSLEKSKKMFDIDEEDFSDFCAFCCREQITDTYGDNSDEMDRFESILLQIDDDIENDANK